MELPQGEAQPPPTPPGEDALDELVCACLERLESGDGEGLGELLRSHPESAEEIGLRLAALRSTGLLAGLGTEPFPGRLGDFRLIERLGSGGMGVVYRAEQISLAREVALKLVRPELLFFPGRRERFRLEVEASSRLSHPSIADVYVVGEELGLPYFAMELVAGATLAEVVARFEGRDPSRLCGADLSAAVTELALTRGARSGEPAASGAERLFGASWWEAALWIGREVAQALEHAHQRGVLHRDVKPSNVMLTPAGRVLLVDFGLASARGVDGLTRSGSQTGSLPYMAPEQLRDGAQKDERVDVYGLGVTLYELVSLRRAYDAESATGLARRIEEGRPQRLRTLHAGLPRDVEVVVATAMAPEPALRYRRAADLARDLTHALDRRPIEARPAGPWVHLLRWGQRNPLAAAASATALALALGGSLAFALRERASARELLAERDQARAERERAERNLDQALDAVDLMLARTGDEVLASVPRMAEVRRQLLQDAISFYAELLEGRRDDPRLTTERLALEWRLAALQIELGELAASDQGISELESEVRERLERAPGDAQLGHLLASALNSRGLARLRAGDEQGALAAMEAALAELRRPSDASAEDPSWALGVAQLEINIANTRRHLGAPAEEVLASYARAEDLMRALPATEAARQDGRVALVAEVQLGHALADRAAMLLQLGRLEESLAASGEGLERLQAALARDPSDPDVRQRCVYAALIHASCLIDSGRADEARAAAEQTLPLAEALVADFPGQAYCAELHDSLRMTYCVALSELGELEAAEWTIAELVESLDLRRASSPGSSQLADLAALCRANYAETLAELGRFEEAEALLAVALPERRALLAADPADPHQRESLGNLLSTRARLDLERGDLPAARAALLEAETSIGADPRALADLAERWLAWSARSDRDPSRGEGQRVEGLDEGCERALRALERAARTNWTGLSGLASDPRWEVLRGSDGFEALLAAARERSP